MKKKHNAVVTRSATELASALGLTPADAVEIEVRSTLNDKIIRIVAKHGLTHAQVAKIAETSRTRMTAILNRNTQDVSTDLLLRILARLGYRVKIRFSKAVWERRCKTPPAGRFETPPVALRQQLGKRLIHKSPLSFRWRTN